MVDLASDEYELDIGKARHQLGWEPKRCLIDTLPRMVEALTRDLGMKLYWLPVILQLAVYGFVEIQGMSNRELRERFDLPGSCAPNMSALRTSSQG